MGGLMGYFGREKTYMLLSDHFYWPKMRRDVERFVPQCTTCHNSKSKLNPLDLQTPFPTPSVLFPLPLTGREKQWFYTNKSSVDTWNNCVKTFLAKFFTMGKTNALCERISNFQQTSNESIPEAWERIKEYILACPHHGVDNWLIVQNFYNGLTQTAHDHVDATAGGAFFSLTIERATTLIEKMVSKQD